MAASKRPPQAITEKIVALMTGKRIKASEQVPSGVRIIPTVYKSVEDPDTAFKEANAARLARAKYDQALSSDDPVVVSAMLSDIEDDGTAGAALLKNALVVLQDQRRTESLLAHNKTKQHKRDSKAERYRNIANDLGLNWRDEPHAAAEKVRAKLTERGEMAPSVRTLARAFGAK